MAAVATLRPVGPCIHPTSYSIETRRAEAIVSEMHDVAVSAMLISSLKPTRIS